MVFGDLWRLLISFPLQTQPLEKRIFFFHCDALGTFVASEILYLRGNNIGLLGQMIHEYWVFGCLFFFLISDLIINFILLLNPIGKSQKTFRETGMKQVSSCY